MYEFKKAYFKKDSFNAKKSYSRSYYKKSYHVGYNNPRRCKYDTYLVDLENDFKPNDEQPRHKTKFVEVEISIDESVKKEESDEDSKDNYKDNYQYQFKNKPNENKFDTNFSNYESYHNNYKHLINNKFKLTDINDIPKIPVDSTLSVSLDSKEKIELDLDNFNSTTNTNVNTNNSNNNPTPLDFVINSQEASDFSNQKSLSVHEAPKLKATNDESKDAFYVPKNVSNFDLMTPPQIKNNIVPNTTIGTQKLKYSASVEFNNYSLPNLHQFHMQHPLTNIQNLSNINNNLIQSLNRNYFQNNRELECGFLLGSGSNNQQFRSRTSVSYFTPFDSHQQSAGNPFIKPALSCLDLKKLIKRTNLQLVQNKEKPKENTDILEIVVKTSEKDVKVFKIRRFDDMFNTVKVFCEINKMDGKLIKPFIIYIIKALNSIYGIYNLQLKNDEIEFLNDLKKQFIEEYGLDLEDIEDDEEDKNSDKENHNPNRMNLNEHRENDHVLTG